MANDQDLNLKNGMLISGSAKCPRGYIFADNFLLDTGTYFKDTLTSNANYGFSNASDVNFFQIEVTGASSYTINWPSSVEWAGGTAAEAPAAGEKAIFTFFTFDGGTSFVGTTSGSDF